MAEVAAEREEQKARKTPETGASKEGAGSEPSAASGAMKLREHVVAKIAGLAAREVEGVHSMGTGTLMEKLAGGGDVKRGVRVKVGQKEAAFDLWLTVDYGCHIPAVVDLVRQKVTERIFNMTGLVTKEINIEVADVVLPEQQPQPAVQ